MRRAHHRKNDKHRLLFLSFLSFFLLSPKFKRAAGFCRLGSYTGHNTRPSSYSPSCPSLTKQSPSVTSSSDRRRPLGLCQDWVMCECWTGIREKKQHTTHRRAEVRRVKKLPSSHFCLLRFSLGKNMPGLCERREGGEEKNWKKRSRRLNTGKSTGRKKMTWARTKKE